MAGELNLSNLQPAQARKDRKRVGRGMGSGKGRYSGRGIKGQKSRAGSHMMRAGFEGGQMPLYMRTPKLRGNTSADAMPIGPFRTYTQPVNLRDLEARFEAGDEVTPESLKAKGLIRSVRKDVKLLGVGELTKKLSITVHGASATAREKVEAAGGTLTLLGSPRCGKPKNMKRRPEGRSKVPRHAEAAETPPADGVADAVLARQRLAGPGARRRLLFTAAVLACYRLGSLMPAPGVDSAQIENFFNGKGGSLLGLLNLFSGSALSRFSIFALGIMPYVTASIILQLMTVVIPTLEQLQKEGEAGLREDQPVHALPDRRARGGAGGRLRVPVPARRARCPSNPGRLVLIVVTLTAGTTLLMWMGELITKRGIGNGISLLIFASILTSAPAGINAWINGGPIEKLFFPLVAIGVVVAVVFVQEGQRRIPIQYAKRMVGRRQTAGGSTYMPLRVNMAGVIPVIFAAALLALPQTVSSFAPDTQTFINAHFSPNG